MSEETHQDGIGDPDSLDRLWTPHRMAYIRASPDDPGCPFCAIPGHDEDSTLVVARGGSTYAVLNLHPYNPGHLMVVPYRHVAELEDLTDDETAELAKSGIPAIDILAAASWAAREFLGRPGIEEGAPADVVVYPADPREDIAVLGHPTAVIRRGRIVR